jgi:hypothetical protein
MRTGVLNTSWQLTAFATLFAAISTQAEIGESTGAGSVVPATEGGMPAVLTTAEKIHRLAREEAALGHRAVIRGVVTCTLPDSAAMVVQDATRGIRGLGYPGLAELDPPR